MAHCILITGCSGGGKSTLLEALKSRGHAGVTEPGRRVITKQHEIGGDALPWADMVGFAREALALAKSDLETMAHTEGPVFFDRGTIDAATALQHYAGTPVAQSLSGSTGYHKTVFIAPPWPAIYETDAARQHGFDEAVAEYHRLHHILTELGYETVALPRTSAQARVAFVLSRLP